MITTDQARLLSGSRNAVALTRFLGPDGDHLALGYAQVGVPFVSEHSAYLTVYLRSVEVLSFTRLKQLVGNLHASAAESDFAWVVVTCVNRDLWTRWSQEIGAPLEAELFQGADDLRRVLEIHPPYALDGGELFFQIQSYEADRVKAVAARITAELKDVVLMTDCTIGDSLHGGRIYGGRMLHGLISSVDPVCFSTRALIGDELPSHKGACFCLTQRFIHDWQQLLGMADNEVENLIGRDHLGNIIVNDDPRAHIKLVRVNDENGLNYRLVGQSQPFRGPTSPPGKEDGVYQLSYAKSLVAFAKVLQNMIGDQKGYIKCRHLNVSHADLGNFWYVPSAPELGLPAPHSSLTVLMNGFFDRRSANTWMFYNTRDYLYRVGNRNAKLDPPVNDRVVELLGYTFSRWHDTWYRRRPAPELGHLKDYLPKAEAGLLAAPLAERKGLAIRQTLELLSQPEQGRAFDTFRLHPRELIVGVVPDFTLGSGFEAMSCLDEERGEVTEAFLLKLNDAGAAGHNVPDYKRLLMQGVSGLIEEARQRREQAADAEAKSFYQSVMYALDGVRIYLRNYAALARDTLKAMRFGAPTERANLQAIADRMEKLAEAPPQTFIEAAQLVFSMHCCLHMAGESVSIGRLDQLLMPFLASDLEAHLLQEEDAQEIIDCFWIKLDEKVLLNHRHFNDRLSRGSCAITYQGGDFPQGAALNQWVQQVTVGGYKANDALAPEDGCNAVTRMCLRAARRLPLNAPCLSLRVNPATPPDVLEEAAKTVLSGGGHPFLMNDDKLIAGLMRSGQRPDGGSTIMRLGDARDVVCDGCFEALAAGKCEFAFSFVPVPEAIEMTLNRGRTYAMAGPVHISGLKASFRSPPAEQIRSWDEFYALFLKHYRYKLIEFYDGMLARYGNLSRVCPSPLLSPLIAGCLESGRDLSAGGAQYKLLTPLMNGITAAIDSLWTIQCLVFSSEAVFTLPELTDCLINDWGWDMKEPFYSQTIGEDRIAVQAERYKKLRLYALSLPKFGQGHAELDAFARQLVRDLVDMVYALIHNPEKVIAERLASLRQRYGTGERPFEFVICPGIATFEDYAGIGSFLGASADGRRSGQPVASDFSSSPAPLDLPVPERGREATACLGSWSAENATDGDPAHRDPIGVGLSNGSPADIKIRESFPLPELVRLIRRFAQGDLGPNMMSISCADSETLEAAQRYPERYDLIRMRMGGWSEFFVAMFPQHQEHHKRRPIFEAARIPPTKIPAALTATEPLAAAGGGPA